MTDYTSIWTVEGNYDFAHPDKIQVDVRFQLSKQAAQDLGFARCSFTMPEGYEVKNFASPFDVLFDIKQEYDSYIYASSSEKITKMYEYFDKDINAYRELLALAQAEKEYLDNKIVDMTKKVSDLITRIKQLNEEYENVQSSVL